MLNDIRYGFRYVAKMFRKEFGSTLVTVLTLALAIGANTAIFGVMNALLFKVPVILPAPEELVTLARTTNGRLSGSVSYPNYVEYRNQTDIFNGVAAFDNGIRSVGLSTPAGAQEGAVALVSGNYFDVFGVRPRIGRFFSVTDEEFGRPEIAVVSHRVWANHFGRDAGLVGKSITLNGRLVSVVGVAPEQFYGADLRSIDVWIPLTSTLTRDGNTQELLLSQTAGWLSLVGRLNTGVSVEQAQAKLDIVSQRLMAAAPDTTRIIGIAVLPYGLFPAEIRGAVQTFLSVLMVIAVFLLVIACANVAGIGLARAATRKREIAVRLAVGASRGRVIRQLLTETSVLFAISAVIGVVLAQWVEVVLERVRVQVPFTLMPIHVSTDLRMVVFTVAVTAITAWIAGLTPALHGTQTDIATAMKEDSASTTYRRSRLRSALVIAQVALSFVLLFAGGLFLRSLMRVASADLGFEPQNVQVASLDFFLAGVQGAEADQLERDLLTRVSSLPGVESASFAIDLPMDQNAFGLGGINVPGHEPPRGQRVLVAPLWNVVSPGYFRTLKIPLLHGRDFNETDRNGNPSVAIINETMAARFWNGMDAIGQTFYWHAGPEGDGRPVQVIGVAGNVNTRGINEDLVPFFIYVPYAQAPNSTHQLIIRTVAGADVFPSARAIIRALSPNLPILNVRSMDEVVGFGLIPQRLAAWIAGIMGLVGTLLAALGIYGVTSYAVSSRTREIGIRMALGAEPRRVQSLIVRESFLLAAIGFGLGTIAAFGLAQLIRTFLYVSATDLVTFGAVALFMCGAAALATYFPSRRAIHVDPMIALRHE